MEMGALVLDYFGAGLQMPTVCSLETADRDYSGGNESKSKEVSEMDCRERLESYLNENKVAFEVMTHAETFTMQEVAAALHVPGTQVAKVVMVWADVRWLCSLHLPPIAWTSPK